MTRVLIPVLFLALAAACGDKPEASSAPVVPAAATATARKPSTTPITPCPTCKVITVGMYTTGDGNYFEPKEIEANEGDILRFTLKTGVHNVNFLPDSNPSAGNLPGMSDLLQLPGQAVDVLLDFGTGKFYFQCDPHALLGMIGYVTVKAG